MSSLLRNYEVNEARVLHRSAAQALCEIWMLRMLQLRPFPPRGLRALPSSVTAWHTTPRQRLRHHYDAEEYLTNPNVYLPRALSIWSSLVDLGSSFSSLAFLFKVVKVKRFTSFPSGHRSHQPLIRRILPIITTFAGSAVGRTSDTIVKRQLYLSHACVAGALELPKSSTASCARKI
jgi:hypothetical protein